MFTWEKSTAFVFKQDFSDSVSLKSDCSSRNQNSLWKEIKKTGSSLHPWGTFLG